MSRIRANQITNKTADGATTATTGFNVTGVCTATSFSGNGSALTGITQVGGATGVDFNDNIKIRMGTGNDLEIYHDNSNRSGMRFTNPEFRLLGATGSSSITLGQSNSSTELSFGERYAVFNNNGSVDLFYNSTKRIETTNTGAKITGDLSVTGVLTYEDVTNVDSVGIITARDDIKVGSGVTITPAGAGFYAGIVTATSFSGSGASLTGITVTSDSQENTLAGTNAGDAIITYGERNCFFGFDAGTDLTTGSDNIFIGHRAGEDVTIANNNTVIGSLSGERLTDQARNTFVGGGAGMEVQSPNNIYIGYYSGKNHGGGDGYCIGIGNECNYNNGGRIANIAIGHRSLYGNFSNQKEFNLAIGHHALYTSRGDFNIGIGASVGGGSADPAITGTKNTLIGTYAGQNLTSGSDNTIIGDRAGDLIDAGTNCIIIGHDADASSNGVLNEITLGDTNISKFRIPGINFEINQEKVTTKGLDTNGMLKEHTQIVSGKLSDNVNINTSVGNVYHFTTQETTTSTPNIRFDGVAGSFNSNVDIGDTVSVTIITTAAAAAYSANLNIDGSSVTVNWVGGSAPSDGGSSGVDIYTYNIIKTANNTFTVIGNQTKTS